MITAEQWAATVARKPRMLSTIQTVLAHHFGKADPEVMRAFKEVPREYFHYRYDEKMDFAAVAYEEESTPWRIGLGSALSDYRGQAYMTQLCEPKAGERALEIGTGSGFQVSILSRIVERAYSIEIVEPLGKAVAPIFKPLGYDNIETRVGGTPPPPAADMRRPPGLMMDATSMTRAPDVTMNTVSGYSALTRSAGSWPAWSAPS